MLYLARQAMTFIGTQDQVPHSLNLIRQLHYLILKFKQSLLEQATSTNILPKTPLVLAVYLQNQTQSKQSQSLARCSLLSSQ